MAGSCSRYSSDRHPRAASAVSSRDVADDGREQHRFQLQLLGTRELEEPVDDLVETLDLAEMMFTCFDRSSDGRPPAGPGTMIGSFIDPNNTTS